MAMLDNPREHSLSPSLSTSNSSIIALSSSSLIFSSNSLATRLKFLKLILPEKHTTQHNTSALQMFNIILQWNPNMDKIYQWDRRKCQLLKCPYFRCGKYNCSSERKGVIFSGVSLERGLHGRMNATHYYGEQTRVKNN